jgi:hypothetical protein
MFYMGYWETLLISFIIMMMIKSFSEEQESTIIATEISEEKWYLLRP